jgi:hypothetical protein
VDPEFFLIGSKTKQWLILIFLDKKHGQKHLTYSKIEVDGKKYLLSQISHIEPLPGKFCDFHAGW